MQVWTHKRRVQFMRVSRNLAPCQRRRRRVLAKVIGTSACTIFYKFHVYYSVYYKHQLIIVLLNSFDC